MKKEVSINVTERQMISDTIKQVKESVLKRCKELKCNSEDISNALYSIQDYIDEQNSFAE